MSRFLFKSLIKNTFIVSFFTLISRLLGFVRDILIARFFGTSGIIEAFLVAFRLPNMFRSLLGEGASQSVVIPVASEYKDKPEFYDKIRHILLFLGTILFALSVLGVLFARYLVAAFAPGFLADPGKFQATIEITRIVFFYLFFIGLASNLGGILYLENNFFAPSFSPVILNIVLVTGIIFSVKNSPRPVFVLAYLVLLSGILQCLWNYFFLAGRLKLRLDIKRAFCDSSVLKVFKLSLPRIWGVAVYHINLFADTILASFSRITGVGAIAAIYYSNRLLQFPLAIFALGICRAVMPRLSVFNTEDNKEDFAAAFNISLRNLSFFLIPSSFVLFFLAAGLVDVVFKRGEFDNYSVSITALCLRFYSLGLFFYGGVHLLSYTFYSLKDTFTPAKTATFALIINVVLSVILMFPLKIGGIALASSVSAAANFILLLFFLKKRLDKIAGSRDVLEFAKVLLACGIMILVLHFFAFDIYKISGLLKSTGVCLAVFLTACWLLKVEQVQKFGLWILKKR